MTFLSTWKITKTSYVSVVGSGGKSTLMKRFAQEAQALSWPTILTTTTHIHLPFFQIEEALCIGEKIPEGLLSQSKENPLILISQKNSPNKGKGFSPSDLQFLSGKILLLVEADGSRQMPFKVPASWEPVVPFESTHTILVCGMSALDQPLAEPWVHRLPLLEHSPEEQTVTPALVARTLAKPEHYLSKIPPESAISIYLSQCDTEAKRTSAQQIHAEFQKIGFCYPVFMGNIGEQTWIEKIEPGEETKK